MKLRQPHLPRNPTLSTLHDPVVNAGRFTQRDVQNNRQRQIYNPQTQPGGFKQNPQFIPASDKPCPCCSYSNQDIIKMLAKIHPPDGDPSKCCFRGPDYKY